MITEKQKKVLDLIKKVPGIRAYSLSLLLEWNYESVIDKLKRLERKGYIKSEHGKNYTASHDGATKDTWEDQEMRKPSVRNNEFQRLYLRDGEVLSVGDVKPSEIRYKHPSRIATLRIRDGVGRVSSSL